MNLPYHLCVEPAVLLTSDDVGVDTPRVLVGGHLQLDPAATVQSWHRTPADHARCDLAVGHLLYTGKEKERCFGDRPHGRNRRNSVPIILCTVS